MRKIILYKQNMVAYARELHNNMTLAEIALWREVKGKKLGVRFSDLDVKNNLGWVLNEINVEIERLKPTPSPSQEGRSSEP